MDSRSKKGNSKEKPAKKSRQAGKYIFGSLKKIAFLPLLSLKHTLAGHDSTAGQNSPGTIGDPFLNRPEVGFT